MDTNGIGLLDQRLSEQELLDLKAQWVEKHAGHEKMHAEMFAIIFGISVLLQVSLIVWRRWNLTAYKRWTLAGMWLMPFLYCLYWMHINFLLAWVPFSLAMGWITYMATRRRLSPQTPRLVYRYFCLAYRVCNVLVLIGQICLVLFLLGLDRVLFKSTEARRFFAEVAITCLTYGLYFGCLVRDFAEISAESMANFIGFYEKDGLPRRLLDSTTCAVCGEGLFHGPEKDREIRLTCNHSAHEVCLLGWHIVGKKSICPYCKEKVDSADLPQTPWQRQGAAFTATLDVLRGLVA